MCAGSAAQCLHHGIDSPLEGVDRGGPDVFSSWSFAYQMRTADNRNGGEEALASDEGRTVQRMWKAQSRRHKERGYWMAKKDGQSDFGRISPLLSAA
jgi:hypothetical protein